MSEDPYVAMLLEVAKQNLHANAMAQAIPMVISMSAERIRRHDYGPVPPDGMLIIPDGLRLPGRGEKGLSHHTDLPDFGRYGAIGRDNFGATAGVAAPVRVYLSDCPSFAPLDLGLWL